MGWIYIQKWAKDIERRRKEKAEWREAIKGEHKKTSDIGDRELPHIKLSAEEKEKLQAKILETQRAQFEKGTRKKVRRAFEEQPITDGYQWQSLKTVQSSEARLSLILGCLAIVSVLFISIFWSAFWLPGLAIFVGVRGLQTINRKGVLQFTGKGQAIAGISLGVLSYVILIVAFMRVAIKV